MVNAHAIKSRAAEFRRLLDEPGKDAVLGFLLASGALAFVLVLHAAFALSPALQPIYVLPIWIAARHGGLRSALAAVVLSAASLSVMESANSTQTVWAVTTARVIVFSGFAYLFAHADVEAARFRLMALRDGLTGLANRHGLREYLDRRSSDETAVAVMIDCDGFKALNDAYGHGAGDHVLQMLARVLEHETRAGDLVARFGGDEFVVVFEGVTAEQARGVMERIQRRFEGLVHDAGYECTFSFGCAPVESEVSTLDELLGHADDDLYTRKEGRNDVYLN